MANDTRDEIDLTLRADPRVIARKHEEERKRDMDRAAAAQSQADQFRLARENAQKWGMLPN